MTKAELQRQYDELVTAHSALLATCAIHEQKIKALETVEKAVRAAHEELKQSSYEERQALEAKARQLQESVTYFTTALDDSRSRLSELDAESAQIERTATIFAMLYCSGTKHDISTAMREFWSAADFCQYSDEDLGNIHESVFISALLLVSRGEKIRLDHEEASSEEKVISFKGTQSEIDELVRLGFIREVQKA